MDELGELVYWNLPGLTQRKLEDHRRPGTCGSAKRRGRTKTSSQMPTVHVARCIQRRPRQHRWNSQKVNDLVGSPWEMMPKKNQTHGGKVQPQDLVGNGAETRSPPWIQVMSRIAWRTLRCMQIEVWSTCRRTRTRSRRRQKRRKMRGKNVRAQPLRQRQRSPSSEPRTAAGAANNAAAAHQHRRRQRQGRLYCGMTLTTTYSCSPVHWTRL